MTSKLTLVFDRFKDGNPYPNLAPWQDLSQGYGDLGNQYPNIVPLRLLYYVQDHDFGIDIFSIDQEFSAPAFYPIGIGFFRFDVDYLALLDARVLQAVHDQRLKLLFYYHEGDNPGDEKTRLDDLCRHHGLTTECYRFVSGNTAARHIPGFVYFPDHELFYWRANRANQPRDWNPGIRPRTMTVLSRTHKWWRASVMADMHRFHMLGRAYWSYNNVLIDDAPQDNPISLDRFPGLRSHMDDFISGSPYTCDTLDSQAQNRHDTLVPEHFDESYFQVVLETMIDADGSGGTFLTEKTFKPIKHAQPFVLIAPPRSLQTLRDLGYRTYDHCIHNDYDSIIDTTQRWIYARSAINSLLLTDLHQWAKLCRDDALHNQTLFTASKRNRLQSLVDQLHG